jgi:hypothetical protein
MGTVPNFNYADTIQRYLDTGDAFLVEEMRGYRQAHPKKFLAALRWAVGDKTAKYKELDKLAKEPKHVSRRLSRSSLVLRALHVLPVSVS